MVYTYRDVAYRGLFLECDRDFGFSLDCLIWMDLLCPTPCPSHFISYIYIYAQHRHQLQRLAMPAGRQGPQKPSPPIAGVAVQMWQNYGYYLDFGYSMAIASSL